MASNDSLGQLGVSDSDLQLPSRAVLGVAAHPAWLRALCCAFVNPPPIPVNVSNYYLYVPLRCVA